MFNFSSAVCWKDYLFSTELPLQPSQKSIDHIYLDLFLDFLLPGQYRIALMMWLYKPWSRVAKAFQTLFSWGSLMWMSLVISGTEHLFMCRSCWISWSPCLSGLEDITKGYFVFAPWCIYYLQNFPASAWIPVVLGSSLPLRAASSISFIQL